jgi:hypothetical protein
MMDVEGQAHEACVTYCGTTEFTHVYAMTTLGTTAGLWKFEKDTGLAPLFGSQQNLDRNSYIDANSPEAYRIKDGLTQMKNLPPSHYDGQAGNQQGFVRSVQILMQSS